MLPIPHSSMWTSMFFVVCISVGTVRTSELRGRRCCEENQVLRSGECVPSNNATSFSPPFYANLSQPLETISWHFDRVLCSNGGEIEYIPLNGANNSLEIKENVIYLKLKIISMYNSSPDFCVGLDAHGENQYIAAFCISASEKKCCADGSCPKRSEVKCRALVIKTQLQTAGLLISGIFLSLTIVLHLAVPTLRDMQTLCLLCHASSLLVADAVLCTRNLLSAYLSTVFCIADAYILQYSILAAFFWLNVMCIDVWRTVKSTVNLVRVTEITSNQSKKFLLYCAYAWGVPLVVIVGAAVYCLRKYRIDEFSCTLKATFEDLIYFYILAGLTFFLSLVLLGHTIVMLIQAGGAFNYCFKKNILTAFNRNHLDGFWQRFSLFCLMALFCLVNFLIVILSWLIFTQEIWLSLLHFFTFLQGFMVLLIFTSNKKKREAICNLFKNKLNTAAKRISGMDTTGRIWFVTNVPMDSGNSNTKHTVEEGSTQESWRAETSLGGIVNEGFEGSEQKTNGD